MGAIRTSNPNALETKVIATVTTPGKRKTEEKEMQLIGVNILGKRYVTIIDDLGRHIMIPVTKAVEDQLRCALRLEVG